MVYGIILAGGNGTRMGQTDKPKQFLLLNNVPIFIYTVKQFLLNDKIAKTIICAPKKWHTFIKDNIEKYIINTDNIIIVESGLTRNDTMMNGCNYIKDNYGINNNDIVVTHDSVRPFITEQMINDNINYAAKYGAVTTVIEAIDTIITSTDHKTITSTPIRKNVFHVQTPQSFNLNKIIKLFNVLTEREKETLTDGSKIFTIHNEPVYLVRGDKSNIKITTKDDLLIAKTLLKKKL